MEKIIIAIREFLTLSPQKQVIVALIVLIIGMGFVVKYQSGDLRAERELNKDHASEIRKLQEQRVLDGRICEQEKQQQQLRSDSIKEAEKNQLIKFFGGHAEKVEKLLTRKK